MNVRLLYALLVLWLIFVLAPGLSVAFGAFGKFDMYTSIGGTVVLTWILGYLLQFGTFFWIANIVPEQRMTWWFIASLLPWAVDWTVPASDLFAVLWIAAAVGTAMWILRVATDSESLREHGVRATGTVLEVYKPLMNVIVNNAYIKRKVRLRVARNDGIPPYETTYNGLYMIGDLPSAGDRVPLLVDPARPSHLAYDDASSA